MRVTRSFLLLLAIAFAVAFAAAGCVRQPSPWVSAAAAPVVVQSPAPVAAATAAGIDNTIYGSVAPRVPPPMPAQAVAPDSGRGLFMSDAAPARAPQYSPAPVSAAGYAPMPRNQPYTLDSGDRLRVVVFGQDGLSNSYVVDASGHIAMPLIGSVEARGATTDELSNRIADKLRQGFVKEPHVAVEIEAYRPFFILGEVTQPGQYPYVADMTVETAVAIAGGFGPRAYRKTVSVTRMMNGQQVRLTVPASFPLRPGDTVNVGERWF
jgi:protein involved in polysaccharide export with SLBB domain